MCAFLVVKVIKHILDEALFFLHFTFLSMKNLSVMYRVIIDKPKCTYYGQGLSIFELLLLDIDYQSGNHSSVFQ